MNQEPSLDRPLVAKSPPWRPEQEDLLRRLAEEGENIALIAERLKRTELAVRKRAGKLAITFKRSFRTSSAASGREGNGPNAG